MKSRVPILLVVALILFSLAQPPGVRADNAPNVLTVPKGQPIKIGWAGDQSLQVVKASTGTLDGTRMAVKGQNDAGGIDGFKLQVVPKDDQCVADTAAIVAKQFVAEGNIAGIVGHLCSGAHLAAAAIYESAALASVSPTASNPKVTEQGLIYTNTIAVKDSLRSPVDADYLYNFLSVRNLYLIDDGETYGKGLVDSLTANFAAWSGTIAGTATLKRDASDSEIAALIAKLQAANSQAKLDAIYCGCYIEVAAFVSKALSANGFAIPEYGTDAINIKDFVKLVGPANQVVAYSSSPIPNSDDKTLTDFETKFNQEFGKNSYADYGPFEPQAYDAALLLIDAIKRTARLDSDGNLVIDRGQLAANIRATQGLPGLTGTISCTNTGECPTGSVGIFQLPDQQSMTSKPGASGRAWQLVKRYDPFHIPTPTILTTPATTPAATQAAATAS